MGDLSMIEAWLPIPGFEGHYEVSNLGRFRSIDRYIDHAASGKQFMRGKVLRVPVDKHGYPRSVLHKNGKHKCWAVHRAVLAAFLPRPDWESMHVNHIDGNTRNNAINNLEWCTSSENRLHSYRVLGTKNPMAGVCRGAHHNARSVVGTNLKTGQQVSYESISATVDGGFKPSYVSACANGAQKSHKGWAWKHGTAGARVWSICQ